MEELTELDLLKITPVTDKEYLLTLSVNGRKKDFSARIDLTAPVFGINFSDDFIYILRNYRSDIQKLIKTLEDIYNGDKADFPISLLVRENIPELQTA